MINKGIITIHGRTIQVSEILEFTQIHGLFSMLIVKRFATQLGI